MGHIKQFIRFVFCLFLVAASTFRPVFADRAVDCIDSTMATIYKENNILFWNPCELDCITNENISDLDKLINSDDEDVDYGEYGASSGLSAQQVAFLEKWHALAAELGAEYGIPWETAIAQGMNESASGSSSLARNKNNFHGINAIDSDPSGHANSFDTPEAGWRGYFYWIQDNSRYRKAGAFNYPNNPYTYLQKIWEAGYASSQTYVKDISPLIRGIQKYAASKGWYVSDNSNSTVIANPGDKEGLSILNSIGGVKHSVIGGYENGAGADVSKVSVSDAGVYASSDSNTSSANNKNSSNSATVADCIFENNETVQDLKSTLELIEGGLTEAEAQRIIDEYLSTSPDEYEKYGINASTNSGNGPLYNCVAFVKYYLNKYTSLSVKHVGNGRDVVSTLISTYGLESGGSTPKVGAIFSTAKGKTDCTYKQSDGTTITQKCGHTGVVLGIDKSRNKIIIAESGYGASKSFTAAKELELSDYIGNGYTYAYTDSVRNS